MRNPTLTFCKTYMSATLPCLLALALSLLVTPASTSAETTTPPTSEQLDEMFLVGPTAIGSIGMRTVWQSKVTLQGNESAKTLFVTGGDSVFVEDSGCHISRVLITDGRSLWKNACGRVTDKVRGINRVMIGTLDVVYITLDHALVGLDAATGALAHGNKLTRFPLTSGVVYGKHLIFGAKAAKLFGSNMSLGISGWPTNSAASLISHRFSFKAKTEQPLRLRVRQDKLLY